MNLRFAVKNPGYPTRQSPRSKPPHIASGLKPLFAALPSLLPLRQIKETLCPSLVLSVRVRVTRSF